MLFEGSREKMRPRLRFAVEIREATAISGPLPAGSAASPNILSRACWDAPLLFTSVKVVVQFSSAAMCGIEPMKLRPGMLDACCWMRKRQPCNG